GMDVGVIWYRRRWGAWNRAREAGCWCRLGDAVHADECFALAQMGMLWCLGPAQHWREAGVAILQQLRPLVAGARCKYRGQAFSGFCPGRAVGLRADRCWVYIQQA